MIYGNNSQRLLRKSGLKRGTLTRKQKFDLCNVVWPVLAQARMILPRGRNFLSIFWWLI